MRTTRRTRPSLAPLLVALLPLLLLLSRSFTHAAFPSQQGSPIIRKGGKVEKKTRLAPPPLLRAGGGAEREKKSRFPRPAAAMASSIRRKTGEAGAAATALSSSVASNQDPDNEKEEKVAIEALDAIKSCSEMAVAAFVSDVFITLAELETLSKKAVTWIDAVDLCDSLNLLVFAHGLWKVSGIYAANMATEGPMSPDMTVELCSTMAGLWRNTALVMVGLSVSGVTSLEEYLTFLPNKYILPAGVAVLAFAGRMILGTITGNDASDTVKKEGNVPLRPGYDDARAMGFVASRNMRFCTASFALFAAVQFASWIVKPSEIVDRIFSVFDFITPFTIAGLLLALYRSFLRAVVNVTSGNSAKDVGYAKFSDLFEAQKGFYNKAAETLKSQAIFAVLPYAFNALKPVGLAIFHFVAGKLGLVEMPKAAA